jgi:CheY-like chemotaxis protein
MNRILIVDDNFENRMLLAEILREIAVCDFAATGKKPLKPTICPFRDRSNIA